MKIIVGLGNIGKEYINTKHNFGFMFIEYLEDKYNFKCDKKMKKSLIAETKINNEKVVFVKPQTYMNLSGEAILEVLNWYKEDISNVLVIYDDLDIPFETIRYKESGSAGTHNGMRNIINLTKTNEICRIRLGMGNLKHENEDLVKFVLSKFKKDELTKIKEIFTLAEIKMLEYLDK